MFRVISFILGIGLIVLWIAGGSSTHASDWLPRLDGLAGLIAIAMGIGLETVSRAGVFGWGLLALGLFILWIVGLAAGGGLTVAWWTFGFACAFVILAAAATSAGTQLNRRTA
jgi:hypothetical protein